MTNTQIQDYAEYIIDLEEALQNSFYDAMAMKNQMPIIYQKIEFLVSEISKTPAEDGEMKIVLVSMEMKLRKCLECIKNRTGVNN
jgi:hypothetical protein